MLNSQSTTHEDAICAKEFNVTYRLTYERCSHIKKFKLETLETYRSEFKKK